MSRHEGYDTLEEIDTTYGPSTFGDHVWVQRSRTIVRRCHAWALVCFICDHRWPNYTWRRMVSLRRYRWAFGRWKEKSAINIRADDLPAIMEAIKEVEDVEIGEPSLAERALHTG